MGLPDSQGCSCRVTASWDKAAFKYIRQSQGCLVDSDAVFSVILVKSLST